MRELKTFLKQKKWMRRCGECKCLLLNAWRCGEFCGCGEGDTLILNGIDNAFIMPGTEENFRIFANSTYIAVTNDDGMNYYFIASEAGRTSLPASAEYEYVVVDADAYATLSAALARADEASDASGAQAETTLTTAEKAIIVNAYKEVANSSVYFKRDGEGDSSKPLELEFDVYGYSKQHLGKMSVTNIKGNAALYIGDDNEALMDYIAKAIAQPHTEIFVDYKLSKSIREAFAVTITQSVISGNVIRVHSDVEWLYDLSAESDGTFIATAGDWIDWVDEGKQIEVQPLLSNSLVDYTYLMTVSIMEIYQLLKLQS